jgi:hypothetical protein
MGLSIEETKAKIEEYISQLEQFQTLLRGTGKARDRIRFPNSINEIGKEPPK